MKKPAPGSNALPQPTRSLSHGPNRSANASWSCPAQRSPPSSPSLVAVWQRAQAIPSLAISMAGGCTQRRLTVSGWRGGPPGGRHGEDLVMASRSAGSTPDHAFSQVTGEVPWPDAQRKEDRPERMAVLPPRRDGRRRPAPCGHAAARRPGRSRCSARGLDGPGLGRGRPGGRGRGDRAAGRVAPGGGPAPGRRPDRARASGRGQEPAPARTRANSQIIYGTAFNHSGSTGSHRASPRSPPCHRPWPGRSPQAAETICPGTGRVGHGP